MSATQDASRSGSKPRRFDREVDGILLLDKPFGISSNAALQQARVIYRALKAGHAGSLDPMATGMLPICFGQATKVCSYLLSARKRYRFTARLGERTDTGDAEGQIVERKAVPTLSKESISALLASSLGPQLQTPPMYSALKHDGERMYEIARRGETVERAARSITIHSLELNGFTGQELDITVECSKGTYVRTLAEDLAAKLGTVAHLVALRRTAVDPFFEMPMHTLSELQPLISTEHSDWAALRALLIPADHALAHLATARFDETGRRALKNGQAAQPVDVNGLSVVSRDILQGEDADEAHLIRLYGPSGEFLGLGEVSSDGLIQPRRMWTDPS